MKFEWDEQKAAVNLEKHGISFQDACGVFEDPLQLSILDERFNYFEERWITVGVVDHGLILVVVHLVFSEQAEEIIRIISARRATPKERKQYETYG